MQDGEILEFEQTVDPDGSVRLVLIGELDHVSAEGLTRRLGELRARGQAVRLDLSKLGFIDSGGVRAVLVAVREAEADEGKLEVDRELSWQVKQVFDTLGLDRALWPENGPS